MIQSLYIKDFALIDELDVQLQPGLNILTGQTGAGKSIIIGALNMILGERADTDLIRQGATKAIAEAEIKVGNARNIRELLEDNAVEWADPLILRREIRDSGSRAFINDTPVTIGVLKETGDYLVDLHGQHDHQMLLREENHRGVIDAFRPVKEKLKTYREQYRSMMQLTRELNDLEKRERELQEKLDLYRFQVRELEEAELDPNEEEEIEQEMNRLDNAEELEQKAAAIQELGNDGDINVVDLLREIRQHLQDIAELEPEFETYLDEVESARISLMEMIRFAERYRDGIEFNPQRLEQLRQRQAELNRLQKKYARTIPELIDYLEEIRGELNLAENFDLEIERLRKKREEQREALHQAAISLHKSRQHTGEQLAESIIGELQKMGMPNAQFEVRVEWNTAPKGWLEIEEKSVECTEHGADDVRFFISTNKGEAPKALSKIASGGEISRVMLALKSILAREQSLPVMIFDEIDTGISGIISEKVGRTMRSLAGHCQIIAITHQPQIASQAHQHYRVQKVEHNDRTVTEITPLTHEEHIAEIASLMSGEQVTDTTLQTARELVQNAQGS